jgi:hypothetical protein
VARGGSVVNERVAALLAASAGGGSATP